MCLMMTGRRCRDTIPNGWERRNRCLPTNTNSRKYYGRNIAIDDNRFHQLQELFGFNAIPFNVTLTPDGRIVRNGLLLRAAEAGFDRFILMLEEMKAKLEE